MWTDTLCHCPRPAVRLRRESVPKHVNEISFQDLLPGQQYMITVTSVSGSLINNSTATGRTGKVIHLYMVFVRCFCHVDAVVL